jgi:type IV pilus assembly protein PilW
MFNPRLSIQQSSSHRYQQGASLIELMVGITVGLLVVLAAVGTLMFTSVSSSATSDVTRLQQKTEIFFRTLRFQLEQAGAMTIEAPTSTNEVQFSSSYMGLPASDGSVHATGLASNTFTSVHGTNGSGPGTDILRVSYQDDGNGRDCLGNTPPSTDTNVRILNTYSVNSTSNELLCEGGQTTAGPQAIIDGVEDFQVLYGIKNYPNDTLLTPSTYTYQFLRADQVTQWELVSTVSICIQLRGDNTNHPTVGTLPLGCNGAPMANDSRLHRAYTRTFSLRNTLL